MKKRENIYIDPIVHPDSVHINPCPELNEKMNF
jgi:hypothetical protein